MLVHLHLKSWNLQGLWLRGAGAATLRALIVRVHKRNWQQCCNPWRVLHKCLCPLVLTSLGLGYGYLLYLVALQPHSDYSSPLQVTVAVVRYRSLDRGRIGVTSTLLAERLQVGQQDHTICASPSHALHYMYKGAAVHCSLLMQHSCTLYVRHGA